VERREGDVFIVKGDKGKSHVSKEASRREKENLASVSREPPSGEKSHGSELFASGAVYWIKKKCRDRHTDGGQKRNSAQRGKKALP